MSEKVQNILIRKESFLLIHKTLIHNYSKEQVHFSFFLEELSLLEKGEKAVSGLITFITLYDKIRSERRACVCESFHFYHSISMDLVQNTASLYRCLLPLIKFTYFKEEGTSIKLCQMPA